MGIFVHCILFDSVVGFLPLNIQNKEDVLRVLQQVDTANGYALSGYLDDPLGLFAVTLKPVIGLSEEV